MRRDSPHLRNRLDEEAAAMAVAADPQAVLDAIKEGEAIATLGEPPPAADEMAAVGDWPVTRAEDEPPA